MTTVAELKTKIKRYQNIRRDINNSPQRQDSTRRTSDNLRIDSIIHNLNNQIKILQSGGTIS